MYIGTDLMSANQFGVDAIWLITFILISSIILHFSVTLQYSAYFHIYFKIASKYEHELLDGNQNLIEDDSFVVWLKGICSNPFNQKKEKLDEEEVKAKDPMANLRNK